MDIYLGKATRPRHAAPARAPGQAGGRARVDRQAAEDLFGGLAVPAPRWFVAKESSASQLPLFSKLSPARFKCPDSTSRSSRGSEVRKRTSGAPERVGSQALLSCPSISLGALKRQ